MWNLSQQRISMLLMVDGGKPKIRHKNMANGVAGNGRQYIYIIDKK